MKEIKEQLVDFIESYVNSLEDVLVDSDYLDEGYVEFNIPYVEGNEEERSTPSEDVAQIKALCKQLGVKVLKKYVINDGGDKYSVLRVDYPALVALFSKVVAS
jgi:hypothetical protein